MYLTLKIRKKEDDKIDKQKNHNNNPQLFFTACALADDLDDSGFYVIKHMISSKLYIYTI